ncbi:MAG TPA: BamA/TamA family outer membrane protein [Burkholderiales bacterium]|nr:BamA/TamA family outer membrane protein [Burkholderiales bacterium]
MDPLALVLRAQQDVARLETVLQSFGYYEGRVAITIDGRSLDDPVLPDAIAALPAGAKPAVAVTADLGPLYRIGEVKLEGNVPEGIRDRLGIAPGAPAVAADILAGRDRLLGALLDEGHALARVEPPVAYENPAQRVLDLTFEVDAGPRVDLGEIRIGGLREVDETFVRNRLLVHPGDRFSPSSIERARQDLLSVGVFSGVTAQLEDRLDASGRLPLGFDVQERPRRALGLSAAYSTDLGGSLGASWSHRNLFGKAEQLNLSASLINLGGTAATGIGYNLSGQFIKPDFRRRDQALELKLGALEQSLEAYDQTAILGGVNLTRKLTPTWTAGVGLSPIQERITQQGITRDYTLLGTPLSLRYDSTGRANPLVDPTRGVIGNATLTPTFSFGSDTGSAFFTLMQVGAATFLDLARFDLAPVGRSVIAMRAMIGTALGASQFDLPPDQRFYGGGSATVRGFRYQSIGPRFEDGQPAGGTSIDAAAIEFRQRLFGNFGAVAFVDAGHVSESGGPFQGKTHVGAGVGVRYYTAIGPLRVDLAVPLTDVPGNDSFQVYIGLGQAF